MSSQAALDDGENVGGSESSLKSMLIQQLRQRELKAAKRNDESPMSRLKEFAAEKKLLSLGQHQPAGGIGEAKRAEENLNSQLTGSESHHGPDATANAAVFSSLQAPEKDKSVPEPGAAAANSAAVTSSGIAPSNASIENLPSPLSRLEAFAARRKAATLLSSPAVPFQADSATAAAMSSTDRAAAQPEATAAVKLSAAPSAPPAVVAVEVQPADAASVAMPVRASATAAAGVSLTSTLPPIVTAASTEAHPDTSSRVTVVPPSVSVIASSPSATTPISHFPAGNSVPEPGAAAANSAAVTSSGIAPSNASIENLPSPLSRLEAFAARRKAATLLSSPAVPFQADSATAAAMSSTDRAAAQPEATAAVKLSAAPSAPPAVVAVEVQPADAASVAMPVRASATAAAGVSLTSTLPPIVTAASTEAHPDTSSRVTVVPPSVSVIASSPSATTPISHFPAGNHLNLNRPNESILEIGNVSSNANLSASQLLSGTALSTISPGFSSKNAREGSVSRGAKSPAQHHQDDFEHSSYLEMHFHDGSDYKGEWRGGKFQGFGVYTYADGSRYEGQWSAGKKNGHGKHTYASDGECAQYCWCAGDVYDGEWTLHQRHGSAVYTWSDKSQLDCVWFEGQCAEWHDVNAKILSSKQAALQNESSTFRSNSVDVAPFVENVINVLSTFSSMPSAPTRHQPSTFTTVQPPSSSSGPIVPSTPPPPHTRAAASSRSPPAQSSIHPHRAPVPALPSTFTSLGSRQLQPLRLCSRFLGDVIAMYSLRP
jgi:hypothetical protein